MLESSVEADTLDTTQKRDKWFDQYVRCDAKDCPGRTRGYYAKGENVLGFCQHHFFTLEENLQKAGWLVMVTDGVLVRVVTGELEDAEDA